MGRVVGLAAMVVLLALTACGDDSSSNAASGSATASSEPSTVSDTVSEVSGPSEFFFVVDGPLVTNGPPWDCVRAGTECGGVEGNFGGTIELLDDCIVVQGSDSPPGHKSVVIFDSGVTWDEATSTIRGLRPDPVAIGENVDVLANDGGPPDAWTETYGLAAVPQKVRDCMRTAGTDTIRFNTPWTQIGPAPLDTVPSDTTAPSDS